MKVITALTKKQFKRYRTDGEIKSFHPPMLWLWLGDKKGSEKLYSNWSQKYTFRQPNPVQLRVSSLKLDS